MKLPERFAEFSEARQNGFLKVKKLKEEGNLVAGIFCTFTPLEILDAAGFTAVSLCGMSEETISDAEAHLPRNLCPLIKSSYGFAVSDKCPYTYFADLIVGETTCDGKKKMYEQLGKMKETYILHLPQGGIQAGEEMWVAELHRFIDFLEEKFGVKITEEGLREAARIRNEERKARLRLMELQKQDPAPMGGYELYKTMEGAGFLFESSERLERINSLADEVINDAEVEQAKAKRKKPRLLVTGCPIGGVLEKTVKAIDESGGSIVCFENCSGIKAAWQLVDTEAEDIVRAIGQRYLKIGCSVMTPNSIRINHLRELVKEYKVDGVLEIDLQACTPYCIESREIRATMQDMGIPYMALETDYSQSDTGQIKTRLEAFLESVDNVSLG